MAEKVDNLVLEHPRAIRGDLREMRDTMLEEGHRLERVEIALAGLRRDQGADAEGVATKGLHLDRLAEKVHQIERRLDLAD